jgi:hypothetical protein
LAIAGAAAQVAAQGVADFGIGWIGICGKQVLYRHHEAGSAEAALRASPVTISFLNSGQSTVFADAFDRGDLLALAARGQQGAGEGRHAINQNGTGPAGGIVTAALGAGELQVLTERIEQQAIGHNRQLVRAAIHSEFEKLFFHENSF